MDWVEIGIGVIVLFVAVVGVLFYTVTQQRAALDESRSPELPAERGAKAEARGAGPAIVELEPGESLAAQLRAHAERAELRGLRPYFEVGAVWCPPSKLFGEALGDPRLRAALAGVYLIRADMDQFTDDPLLRELGVVAVPVFFELDAAGRSTGRSITGGAWGADTVENMAAAMAKFCA